MGQINSTGASERQNTVQSAAIGQVSENTATINDNEASARPDSRPNAAQRDRRKSLRDSIVGLVNSKSSRNSEEELPRGSKEGKRWWRRNRRQSKVQLLPQSEPREAFSGEASRSSDPLSQMQTETSNQQAVISVPSEGTQSTDDRHEAHDAAVEPDFADGPDNSSKGKERGAEITDAVAEDQQANLDQTSLTTHSAGNYSSADVPAASNIEPDGDSGLHYSMEGGNDTQTSSSPPENSAAQAPPNDNIFRQFPPSGTLVVVQGVVHTDAISRATRSTMASSSNTGGTSSDVTIDTRQGNSESLLAQPDASADASSSQEISSSTNSVPGANAVGRDSSENLFSTEPSSVGVSGNSQTRGGSNDSHGPDILGALLSIVSVATAATATSLLSAPNGLQPSSLPRPSSAPAASPSPAVNGSNLPLIARALASANPAAAAIIAQREREREEREQNRVRTLWESLRERVSSNRASRSTATAASRSHTSTISSGGDRIDDTSLNLDSLLDELARAFNLGPTPDERDSDAQSTWSARPRTAAVQEGPSDHQTAGDGETNDSSNAGFEQFMIDLQSDLRLELTRPDSDTDVVSTTQLNQNDDREDSRIMFEVPRNDETDESSASTVSPSSVATRSNGGSMVDDSLTLPRSSATEMTTSTDMVNSDDHLSNADNSESTIRTDNHNSSTHEVSESPTNFRAVNQARRRNGINWWRMHRFPPIQPIQGNFGYNALHSEATRASNAPMSNDISGPIPSSPSETQQTPDVVIPVIIVGLQSLSSRRTQPDAHRRQTDEIEARSEDGHRTEDTEYGPRTSAELQHPRDSWSSRAARALGRMGRRDASVGRETEMPGNNDNGRTFLIYVFGGHYPPGHHILSGLGDADSFEALWDLAEFLGQVKPPVVTEEEIERSGLELFKAKSLKELEACGRVASNCVDRCLVCLENYESNDDLRLLTCKHAFHKVCVDRWLKTGRNNCPACRREGVSTGTIPSQQSA